MHPPAASTQYADELGDFIITNYAITHVSRQSMRRNRAVHRSEADPDDNRLYMAGTFILDAEVFSSPGAVEMKRAWGQFREVFNCMPDLAHASVHPVPIEKLREQMRDATISLCFSVLPTVPEAGKWTKTNPCIDYFLPSLCAVPIFQAVWDSAFGKGEIVSETPETEQSWLEKVAWREVASKRVKRCVGFVHNPRTPPLLLLVALLHEPLRWLTGYFLHVSSRRRRRSTWECPLLCSFVA